MMASRAEAPSSFDFDSNENRLPPGLTSVIKTSATDFEPTPNHPSLELPEGQLWSLTTHSGRIAIIGSTRAARRAGSHAASAATAISATLAVAYVPTSVAPMP
jgi:hypothetical protein